MSKSNILVLKNFQIPDTPGTHFCLFCLSGEGKGVAYFLEGSKILVGRSERADLRLFESKVSKEHALITRIEKTYVISDLNSQNGVFINDRKITEQAIHEGDKIVIGTTVFRFGSVQVEEKNNLAKQFSKTNVKKISNKKIIIISLVLLLVLVFWGNDKKEPDRKRKAIQDSKSEEASDNFASLIKAQQYKEDKELSEKLEVVFQRGLREYREGNYFRAINEFNLALILSPDNSRAQFYLSKTKQALDKSVEDTFIMAKKQIEALKYEEAKVAYCSIIRLLKDYPNDDRYKDAQDNLRELEVLMGMDKDEIKCF